MQCHSRLQRTCSSTQAFNKDQLNYFIKLASACFFLNCVTLDKVGLSTLYIDVHSCSGRFVAVLSTKWRHLSKLKRYPVPVLHETLYRLIQKFVISVDAQIPHAAHWRHEIEWPGRRRWRWRRSSVASAQRALTSSHAAGDAHWERGGESRHRVATALGRWRLDRR